MLSKKYLDELTYEIIGSAIEVQKIMGRGLLESVYLKCMKLELHQRNINFVSELKIPVTYKNNHLEIDLRCEDRKSTRLNSSHVKISYAVFCLKKKTTVSTLSVRNKLR